MRDELTPMPSLEDKALLKLIFDHSGEGICVFDAQLRLIAFNDRFVELIGLPLRCLHIGAHAADILRAQALAGEFGAVDVEAVVAEQIATILSKPVHVSERLRSDGRAVELRRSRTPGGGFITMSSDVTERKAIQNALADEQRMLQLLIRHTEQGVWFIDNEHRTTHANAAMCRMLGYSLADMMGRSIFDFVDATDAEVCRRGVAMLAQGKASSYAVALCHQGGHSVHCLNNATPVFDATGQKLGAVGMFTDVSALLQAQDQVRQGSELLKQKTNVLEMTLNSLDQGVASFDAQGRNTAYNWRFLELLELPESVMADRPAMQDLLRYQHVHGLAHEDHSAPEVLERWEAQRYQRTRRDGMVIEVQVHPGVDGSVVRTYSVGRGGPTCFAGKRGTFSQHGRRRARLHLAIQRGGRSHMVQPALAANHRPNFGAGVADSLGTSHASGRHRRPACSFLPCVGTPGILPGGISGSVARRRRHVVGRSRFTAPFFRWRVRGVHGLRVGHHRPQGGANGRAGCQRRRRAGQPHQI
jgi:PAS domain S-box-containing protein